MLGQDIEWNKVVQSFLLFSTILLVFASPGWGQSNCTILATQLTFQDPIPDSAGCALSKILADDGTIYWFDYDASQGAVGGALKSVPKIGGSVTVLVSGLRSVNEFVEYKKHKSYLYVRPRLPRQEISSCLLRRGSECHPHSSHDTGPLMPLTIQYDLTPRVGAFLLQCRIIVF